MSGWRIRTRRARGLGTVAGLTLVLIAVACAKPYDPFRIPAAELRARVHTIALAPLRVSAGVAEPTRARQEIEPLVVEQLAAGGFQVVASDEMERLWRSAAAEVGDVFDPVSGERDEERYEAVEAAVYHELRLQYQVDAVLWMRIYAIELFLVGSRAAFCGTVGPVYWSNPEKQIDSSERATLVLATCVDAALYDLEERMLYGIRSGLETIETFARQTRAERPLEQRLRDPSRLREAVNATLGPLAGPVR